MALTWHPVTATHGSVSLDNVLLFASRAPLSPAVIDGIRRRLVELGRAFPAGLGHVHIVGHDRVQEVPDKETQQALFDLIRQSSAANRASMVIMGDTAAPVQVMTSTVKLVAHAAPTIRIYRTLAEGAGWFCETLQASGAHAPDATDLVEAGEELVRRVEGEGSS